MPCSLSKRAILSPTGHPRIDQPLVRSEQLVRPQTQPLHHAGAEPFDQNISIGSRFEAESLALLALHIHFNAVARPLDNGVGDRCTGTRDANDLCAQIGEQHRDMRARANPCKLDDAQS